MFTLQFRSGRNGDPSAGKTGRFGSAWLLEADRIVTCMHAVSFDDLRWADADREGEHVLFDDAGREVATLAPVLAIPSLDVALLAPRRAAGTAAPDLGVPLDLSPDWLPDGARWFADARPVQQSGHPVRLGGTLARWGVAGRHWQQLTVEQGTDIDWASVSGSPVVHGGRVIGMLKQQLDRGNTCFAVPAHAVALLRWLAADLSTVTDLAARWLAPPADVYAAPSRDTDRLAELLVRPGLTTESLCAELGVPDTDAATRGTLQELLARRPEPPPDSAEADLRRRVRQQRAGAGPTSDSLLHMVFPSADPSVDVFVPPRFRAFQEVAPKAPGSPASGAPDDRPAEAPPLTYADLMVALAAAPLKGSAHRLAVLGEAGAGKSTLLSHLARQVLDDGLGVPVQFHFQQLGPAGVLNTIEGVWLPSLGATDPSYARAVQQLAAQGRLWIFIDGIDEVGLTHREPLAQIARGIGTGVLQGAHVVVASRHAYWYHGMNDLYGFKVYDLEAFSVERVHEVIGQWFGGRPEGRQLVDRLRDPARHYLLQAVRNPLRLAMLCAVWRHAVHRQPAGALPSTRAELYETFLALTYDWNAGRPGVGRVDRDTLMAALSRLALHVLANPVTDTAEGAGAFDEAAITAANPGLAADVRGALVESGWLVRDGATSPVRRRFRFEHRTWMEYLAARGLQRGAELLDLEATPPRTWLVETGWREVVLFWMGRADVAADEKKALLGQMATLHDGVWGLYGDRALHLVPACLRECPCLGEEDVARVYTRIIRQAVGGWDDATAQWLVAFPTLRAAAAAALADGDPEWVGGVALEATLSAEKRPHSPTFAPAMASVLVQSAGDDETCGLLAAHLLLSNAFLRHVPRADALLDNPAFAAELVKAAARPKERARALNILNRADDGSPTATRIAFELLRDGVVKEADDVARLLRILGRAPAPGPEIVALLSARAFDAGPDIREAWFKALAAVTPDPEALGDRLLAPWAPSAEVPKDRRLELLPVLAALARTSRAAAEQVLGWDTWWQGEAGTYDALAVLHQACDTHPGFTDVFLDALQACGDDRAVAAALRDLHPAGVGEPARERLRALMRRDQSAVRFECARILLELTPGPGDDRESALAELDRLVEEFPLAHARIQETPWRAGGLLRSIGLERPPLVDRLIATIEASRDDNVWHAGASCLGQVGAGSTVAARCLLDLMARSGVHPGIPMVAARALSEIGLTEAADVRRFIGIATESVQRDDGGIRWILDAMVGMSLDDPDAAALAEGVVLSGTHDSLTVESAFGVLRVSARDGTRARDVALQLLDHPREAVRQDGLKALSNERVPSAVVTRALLVRLGEEGDAGMLNRVRSALAVQVAGRAEGLLAVPRLRHEVAREDDDPASNERRGIAYELLLEVAARTPYVEFKARWDTPEDPP